MPGNGTPKILREKGSFRRLRRKISQLLKKGDEVDDAGDSSSSEEMVSQYSREIESGLRAAPTDFLPGSSKNHNPQARQGPLTNPVVQAEGSSSSLSLQPINSGKDVTSSPRPAFPEKPTSQETVRQSRSPRRSGSSSSLRNQYSEQSVPDVPPIPEKYRKKK